MRRTLLVTRHAQAGWQDSDATDHARNLTPLGREQASALGALIRERGSSPQIIICSTAARAQQTAALVATALGHNEPFRMHQALYSGGLSAYREAAEALPDEVAVVMVIAHNPAVSAVATRLSRRTFSLDEATSIIVQCDADSWEEAFDAEWQFVAALRAPSEDAAPPTSAEPTPAEHTAAASTTPTGTAPTNNGPPSA